MKLNKEPKKQYQVLISVSSRTNAPHDMSTLLQESLASELAARMSAMSSASDNATELKKSLSILYNRQRQAKITGEILEIVAGAESLG